jgi:hypothetical protein
MRWPQLYETLAALVESVSPEPGSGLRLARADLRVPLEVSATFGPDGPAVYARVPHSRWVAGFQTPASMSELTVTSEPGAPDEFPREAR